MILMSINESIVRASYKCYILNLLNSFIYPSKYMMSIMINNGIVRTSARYYLTTLPLYLLTKYVMLMLIKKKKAMEGAKVSWFAHLVNIQVHDNSDQRKQFQQQLKNIIMTSKPIYILPIDMGLHKWSHLFSR